VSWRLRLVLRRYNPLVTKQAREVLRDCEYALSDFEASANTNYQRTRWVGLITLLRAVGHVLHNVDEPAAGPETRKRMQSMWERLRSSKPEPLIYWQFIAAERNDTIKRYAIRSAVNITVTPDTARLEFGPVVAGAASGFGYAPTTIDFFMREGPFKDRDLRELGRDAIAFWREYLDTIDAA
jgi:hypothetical protein